MNKYLVLALLFLSSYAYSQKNDTCDYFSIGVYGGGYMSFPPVYAANKFISNISVEMEYRKSKEFSFFINWFYLFSGNDIKKMFVEINRPQITSIKNPRTCKVLFTIGGRYYLRAENINPYLQIGLTEEYSYVGDFAYDEIQNNGEIMHWTNTGYHHSRLQIMAGAGLNIKLYKRLHLDVQYNMYSYLGGEKKEYLNRSVTGGLKYNLF